MRYTYQNKSYGNTFIPLSNTISIIVSCCFSSRALKNIKVTKNLEFVQQIACSNLPINLSSLVVASIPRQRGVWVCCVCHQRLSTPATVAGRCCVPQITSYVVMIKLSLYLNSMCTWPFSWLQNITRM